MEKGEQEEGRAKERVEPEKGKAEERRKVLVWKLERMKSTRKRDPRKGEQEEWREDRQGTAGGRTSRKKIEQEEWRSLLKEESIRKEEQTIA